jgi:phosphate/sulfate permease
VGDGSERFQPSEGYRTASDHFKNTIAIWGVGLALALIFVAWLGERFGTVVAEVVGIPVLALCAGFIFWIIREEVRLYRRWRVELRVWRESASPNGS